MMIKLWNRYLAKKKWMPWILGISQMMEQTGNIIIFIQFEEGYLLSEKRNDAESGEIFDDD